MEFYFDAEFDAIRQYRSCIQCLISIGIVAVKDGVAVDQFYSLIKPKRFKKLTRVVREITHLSDEDIRNAPSFSDVMAAAEAFIARYQEDGEPHLYSFGPDDKRTIQKHAAYEEKEKEYIFAQAIDLQGILSRDILWKGKLLSPTLSLDDLKYMYGIKGEVVHNALNDALDLMRIHEASRKGTLIAAHVDEVGKRKERKREETKQRLQQRMEKVLRDRYGRYDGMKKQVLFYPDVIDHMGDLSKHGELKNLRFDERGIYNQGKLVLYENMRVCFGWDMCNHPQVILSFMQEHEEVRVYPIPLTYRNVGILHDIWLLLP